MDLAVSRPTTPSGVPSILASISRRLLDARDLDRHGELELHVGDPGLEHGLVVGRIDFLQVLHAVDEADEGTGVTQRLEHHLARRVDREFA